MNPDPESRDSSSTAPRGPTLQVVLVQMSDEAAGDLLKSTDVGGYLPPSEALFQWRLGTADGKGRLEFFPKFTVLVTDKFVVGKTRRSERDPGDLPKLPDGYVWGARRLKPDGGNGSARVDGQTTYVLDRMRADLPRTFELPRFVADFARDEGEFWQKITCTDDLVRER